LFELAVYRSGLYRTTEKRMFLFESLSECSFYIKGTKNLQKNLILVQKEFSLNGRCRQLN